MLSFLNTAIWPLLAAVALPIIIHLLTKKKLKVVPFSTLAFLKQMQRDQIRRLKLRQLFLLLLRMLMIALLVLAFARPTMRAGGAPLSKRATATLAIILDNSLSMAAVDDGATLLQRARRQAESLTALLQPGDEAYLISAGAPAKLVGGPYRSAETLVQGLNDVPQQWSSTDLGGAIAIGRRILTESKNVNREFYFFSDFRAQLPAGSHGEAGTAQASMRGIAVRFAAGNEQNTAVVTVAPLNQILEAGKTIDFAATLSNTGARAVKSQQAALFLNGKRAAQQMVDIAAGQQKKITLRAMPEAAGFVAGEIRIEDDGILLDNSRYAAVFVPPLRRVLLCAANDEEATFLRLALDPRREGKHIVLRSVAPEALSRETFAETDALVLVNVPRLNESLTRQIVAFVENGGGLMIFPGSAVDLRQYNETLLRAFELGNFGESMGSLTASESVLKIGKLDFSHPLLAGVFEKNPAAHEIDSPAFRFALQFRPGPGAEVVAEYSNGFPLIVEKFFGRGRVLLFTTAADETWSDFAFKGLFAPLTERAVALVASRLGGTTGEALVGAELNANVVLASSAPELEVEMPSGERVRVRPEASPATQGYRVRFSNAAQPGIYKLWNANELLYLWAVNFDAAEAALPALSDAEFQDALPETAVDFTEARADLVKFVRQTRFGNELWPIFLAAAVLAMIGEMLLYRHDHDSGPTEEQGSKRVRRFAESA